MSIFHRKAHPKPNVYTFAGVSTDNDTATRIQHNVDLLQYMADHPHLTKPDLASYLDMCDRFGMGTSQANRDAYLAADLTAEKATKLRFALANVHMEALTECIHELGEGAPTTENVRMIEFAVDESQKTKKAFS